MYTPADEILIEEKWQELQDECRKAKVCRREDDWQFVKRAFLLAKEAHKGVRRRSGEPYIIHPIEVAIIAVKEIGLGKKSVVAALLHDVVEDSHYTFDNLLESGIPTHVVETLRLLTHSKDENYDDYILCIIQPDNKIAIAVKWNDLTHNLERGKRSNHIRQTHGE